MADITITWRGGERTFPDTRPIRVGRAADCDVLVLDERVSRSPHLELRFEGGVWILEDHSSGGTWSGGQRVQRVSVPEAHTFHLGAADGPELTLTPAPAAAAAPAGPAPATAPDPAAAPPAADPVAAAPATPAAPPGDVPRFDPTSTVSLDDRALRLSHGDQKLVVPPGYVIHVGRDEACELTIPNQIVSRQHARFAHDGQAWVLEDLGSTRGTYVDGRRLRGPYRAEGVFEVSLGDDTAGEKVRVVTAGEHRAPKSRLPLVVAIAAFVVALGGVALAVAMSGNGKESDEDLQRRLAELAPVTVPGAQSESESEGTAAANSEAQLTAVKAATVLIEAIDDDGFPLWHGSGTIITEEGHILTNAHVADPPAESLDALVPLLGGLEDRTAPDGFVIYVSPDEDEPTEPRYFAELVASSDVQDASIIRITEEYETGEDVDRVDITPVPIGSSSSLRAGNAIHSLGFPGNATTSTVSVLLGDVVSFVSGDDFERLVGGDDRRVMNTSAVLGQGSSGGPIVRRGKIVGLNATLNTMDGLDRGWAVPIDEIEDLLEEVGLSPED